MQGAANAANNPGGRYGASGFYEDDSMSQKYLYLFAGVGLPQTGGQGAGPFRRTVEAHLLRRTFELFVEV